MFKNLIIGKKAVFFDLDGTVVETAFIWVAAINEVLKSLKLDYLEAFDYFEEGANLKDIWGAILNISDVEVDVKIEDLISKTHDEFLKLLKETPLYAKRGFWELAYELRQEHGFKLALVTNTARKVTEEILRKIEGTTVFDVVLTGDDIKNPKPDSEIYKIAAKQMNLKSNEILVFEDSVSGAFSAAKAGMDMVIIWNGITSQYEYPDTVKLFTDDFEGIAGNLDKTAFEYYVEAARKYVEKKQQATIQA